MSEVLRWGVSMARDPIGHFVTYHDYAMKSEECEALRARVAELEAYNADLVGADKRAEKFAYACVREEGITVFCALEAQRNRIAELEKQSRDYSNLLDVSQKVVRELRAALAKREAVPEGFVLVPVEPTLEMLREGGLHMGCSSGDVWSAMLAAAKAQEGTP